MFKRSTNKKPAAGTNPMVVESLERREMFSASSVGDIVTGAGLGWPRLTAQTAPAVYVAYDVSLSIVYNEFIS